MKRKNRIKHYKSINNALLKNLNEKIYSEHYRAEHTGAWWYQSGYFTDRSKPATLEIVDDMRPNLWWIY